MKTKLVIIRLNGRSKIFKLPVSFDGRIRVNFSDLLAAFNLKRGDCVYFGR